MAEKELRTACNKGNIDKVKQILEGDPSVDINEMSKDGWNPLLNASYFGFVEVARLLLKQPKIEVNKETNDGATPFYLCCYRNHVDITKELLNDSRTEVNKAINTGATPLFIACEKGNVEIVKLLAKDKRIDLNKSNKDDVTPFFIACYKGHKDIVKSLLENERVDVNKVNKHKTSPLLASCLKGREDLVKLLLKSQRIDVNQPNKNQATPFFIACEKGYEEIVKLFLDDKRVDVNKGYIGEFTPFFTACEKGHSEIVQLLLDDPRVDLRCLGEPPLFVACENGHLKVVKILLGDSRIDINQAYDESTPFFAACENGHLEIVEWMLASGKEIKTVNNNKSSLQVAKRNSSLGKLKWEKSEKETQRRQKNCDEIFRILGNFQVNPQITRIELRKMIFKKALGKKIESSQKFKKAVQGKSLSLFGMSPLLVACLLGLDEFVNKYLDEGGSIEEEDNLGLTIFHYACFNGNLELIRTIDNKYKFDINKPTLDGWTPIFFAAYSGNIEVVEYLLSKKETQTSTKDGISCVSAIETFSLLSKKSLVNGALEIQAKWTSILLLLKTKEPVTQATTSISDDEERQRNILFFRELVARPEKVNFPKDLQKTFEHFVYFNQINGKLIEKSRGIAVEAFDYQLNFFIATIREYLPKSKISKWFPDGLQLRQDLNSLFHFESVEIQVQIYFSEKGKIIWSPVSKSKYQYSKNSFKAPTQKIGHLFQIQDFLIFKNAGKTKKVDSKGYGLKLNPLFNEDTPTSELFLKREKTEAPSLEEWSVESNKNYQKDRSQVMSYYFIPKQQEDSGFCITAPTGLKMQKNGRDGPQVNQFQAIYEGIEDLTSKLLANQSISRVDKLKGIGATRYLFRSYCKSSSRRITQEDDDKFKKLFAKILEEWSNIKEN